MNLDSRIYVAGHRGLVGSALVRKLKDQGYTNVLTATRQEADLRDPTDAEQVMYRFRPDYVFIAAAKVGGIDANSAQPVEFLLDNLQIGTNLISKAAQFGVKKLLYLGSSCIYPRECPQPIKEDYLLSGPLEPSNQWYALAKIACLKLCQAYRRTDRHDFISVMPTNLYGLGDNYRPGCHVIPALMRRFHEAKHEEGKVKVWGSPYTLREFMYVDDLALACILAMMIYSDDKPLNIGSGEEVRICDLARLLAATVGLDPARLEYDAAQPSGTPRKLLDSTRMRELGWKPTVGLEQGLKVAYEDFCNRTCGCF